MAKKKEETAVSEKKGKRQPAFTPRQPAKQEKES